MTEDAKPGLSFKTNDDSDARIKFAQNAVEDAINLFEENDLGRLVRLNTDETSYDDGGFSSDFDSFDDGSLF